MFGRATIRLGIGPHSSLFCIWNNCCNLCVTCKFQICIINTVPGSVLKPKLWFWGEPNQNQNQLLHCSDVWISKPIKPNLSTLGWKPNRIEPKLYKKASIRWQHRVPPRASNGGWSLCIQISREWSYPLPIYWYHSKGNWLHYNYC